MLPPADESKKTRDALSYRSARPGDRKVTFRKPPSATAGLELGLKFKESFMKAVYIDKIIPGTEAARLEKEGKIKARWLRPQTTPLLAPRALGHTAAASSVGLLIWPLLPCGSVGRRVSCPRSQVGDEITMVSATFGDEMWSARNVGKYRLEKSIAVRQGMQISFVFENSNDSSKKAREVRSPLIICRNLLAPPSLPRRPASSVLAQIGPRPRVCAQAEVKRQQAEKDKTTRLQKQLAQEVEQEKKKGSFFGGFF